MDLDQIAVLVNCRIEGWGGQTTDREITQDIAALKDIDSDAGRYVKDLIPKDVIKKIRASAARAREKHKYYSRPWLESGGDILPTELYLKYTEEMRKCKAEHMGMIKEELFDQWEALKARHKAKLRGAYRDSDYPSLDILKSRFRFEIETRPVPMSKDFRANLRSDEIDEVKKQIEEANKEYKEKAAIDLWSRLYKAVYRMVTTLSGTNAVLGAWCNQTMLDKVTDLVDMVPAMNKIFGDAKFPEICKEITAKLASKSTDRMKENEKYRQEVIADAMAILKRISDCTKLPAPVLPKKEKKNRAKASKRKGKQRGLVDKKVAVQPAPKVQPIAAQPKPKPQPKKQTTVDDVMAKMGGLMFRR